jgi:subtilase family serine protease
MPMLRVARVRSLLIPVLVVAGCLATGMAQRPGRIAGPIDETQVVTLTGNVHPLARGEFDLGAVPAETRLDRLVLQLESSPAAQAELDALVEAQHDAASPLFHRWLTPAEFGARFGAAPGDMATVTAWLRGHGFTIDDVSASNRLVVFSGTAGQVAETFHTEIHSYRVDGVDHIANVEDPQIPAALAGVVGGVLSLHDFRRKSQISSKRALMAEGGKAAAAAKPEYSSGSTHYLFPADWATIYDLNSVYRGGKTGSGASIAIVGRSNINASDVAQFRTSSGLPANQPHVILVSSNPGLVSGDQDESTLDVEWSGAVAPAATVNFVVGASTATTDGVDLSAQYIVNHGTAEVVSTSYGSCEQDMGSAEMAFYNGLWEQAASQGMSAFVSSGDSGAAGCNGGSSTAGSMAAVNGLCSSPYSTCVGGTEFNEGSNPSQYWSSTNTSNDESALGYIPEEVWNESTLDGGSGLWASTGGASVVYQQPSWQKGVAGASASNGMRAVPDVAMTAASHDGYVIAENGSFWIIAGTSAASPSFAGAMALVVQAEGGKGQGNANPALYGLLNAAKNPFHPTLSGNNSVPGVSGFTASGAAYNLATGLGSVDGAVLLSTWPGSGGTTSSTNFAMTQSAKTGTIQTGNKATFTVNVTESGTAKNSVALTAQTPTGVTATVSPASISPGTTATVTITVGSTASAGAQTVTITGSNSSGTQTVSYALTVTLPPSLAVTAASSTASVAIGSSTAVSLTANAGGSFSGNISWSISGLPTGVTGAWSKNPQAATSGSNAETLTLTAASTAKAQSTAVTVTATGDGLTATEKIAVSVTQPQSIALAVSPVSISVLSLSSAKVTVTATPLGGASAASGAAGSSISIASGLPKGFTAAWSAPSVTTAGGVAWTLTLAGSSSAVAGNSTLNLSAQVKSATGAAYNATATLPMTVTLTPPTLSVTPASASVSVRQGSKVTDVMTLGGNGTVTGAVTLSVAGLPTGVTATWSASAVTLSSGAATSTLTLTAASSAKVGTATVTVTATANGVTATSKLTLAVTQGAAHATKPTMLPAFLQR